MLGEGLERREELADGEENCEMLTSGHSMADARSTCGAHTRSNQSNLQHQWESSPTLVEWLLAAEGGRVTLL